LTTFVTVYSRSQTYDTYHISFGRQGGHQKGISDTLYSKLLKRNTIYLEDVCYTTYEAYLVNQVYQCAIKKLIEVTVFTITLV